jgi:hypothetical protein
MATNPSFDGTGLIVLRTAEVRDNIAEFIQGSSEWGPEAQVGSDKALGQLIDAPAEQIGLIYELVQALYDAWNPSGAEGVHLDNLLQLLGLVRQAASPSTVTLDLTGVASSTVPGIPTGRRCRVPDGPIFYFLGDVTFDGSGDAQVTGYSVDDGEIEALANTITEIVDAHANWSTVNNPTDAEEGQETESDAEARLRRTVDLTRAGRSTDRALRAQLQSIDGVEAAIVISNRTLVTVDGLPGKQFECVIWPNTLTVAQQEEVATAIWQQTPNGIQSYGSQAAVVTDNQGVVQAIFWSWATPIDIYWDITVTKNTEYPATGDDLVKQAVLDYGNSLSVGDDVLPIGAIDRIVQGEGDTTPGVPGVQDLVVKVGTAPSPSGTTPITISQREISDHDSTRITVTS